jgi:GWxTD domain-containing protein
MSSLRISRGRVAALVLPLSLVLVVTIAVPSALAQAVNIESVYRVGITQLEDGDIENAINTFRKVLELDPRHALAHSSLGYIYLRRENIDLARASFQRALELDSGLTAAHNGMGLVLAEDPRTRSQAIESFRQALRIDSAYLDARYNLGVSLGVMEEYAGARNAFNQVLEVDSDFRDVHFQLGLVASRSENYELAEQEFIEQYRRDPNHRENRLELGRVYFETEQFERAEEFLLPLYGQYPDYVPAMLLLADLYLAVDDYGRANQLYLMSYKEFDDEETASRLWKDVIDIAQDNERDEYNDAPLEEMPEFFRRFWKRRDLNPTSDTNLVLVEHYKRLRYARQYFSSPTAPGGYDDRGILYIRHGPPDDWAGFEVGDAETRPNLTWVWWRNRQERLIVHFVDRGHGYFQQVASLMEASEAIPTGVFPTTDDVTGEVENVSELWVDTVPIAAYRERAHIDPMFDRIANQMEEFRRRAQDEGVQAAATDNERLQRLLDTERMEIMQDLNVLESTNDYSNILPTDPLPFHFYTAAFKDIQGRTRLEVYYGVPTEELALERYGDGQKVRIDLGIGVFDDQWNEVERSNEIREFVSQYAVEQAEGAVMVDMNRMLVEPGVYNFAISVQDMNSGRMGVYRDSLRIEDFANRSLAVSDIEMAGRIEESRRGGRFYKEGMEIYPMPSRTYTTEQQIFIYYEIYNLTKDDFGTTAVQTSYTIAPADVGRRRNILSSAFRAIGSLIGLGKRETITVEGEVEFDIRPSVNKYLELDFVGPEPGMYQITLTVKDINSNTEYTRSQEFMVTPPGR